MFQNAKLDKFVERYISIDEVKHWKPARQAYLHAATRLNLKPGQIALISAHDWDIHGAKRAGLAATTRKKPKARGTTPRPKPAAADDFRSGLFASASS
jgi:2-haloacid dehalogenase